MPGTMTIDEWLEVAEDPFSSLPASPHLTQSQTAESPVIQPRRLSQTSATMSPGPVAVPIWNASLSGASGSQDFRSTQPYTREGTPSPNISAAVSVRSSHSRPRSILTNFTQSTPEPEAVEDMDWSMPDMDDIDWSDSDFGAEESHAHTSRRSMKRQPAANVATGTESAATATPTATITTSKSTPTRFLDVTYDDMTKFVNQQKNPNTQRKTGQHLKLFSQFLATKGENSKLWDIAPSELDDYLAMFFLSVRKSPVPAVGDGSASASGEYEPCTLKSMQSSIARVLKENKYAQNILTSDMFFTSREAIAAKCRNLKKQGRGSRPNRKRAPTEGEMTDIWKGEALGDSSPRTLQHTMWWINCTRFGKRANLENYKMKWGDVKVEQNKDGVKYLTSRERETKTRQGQTTNDTKDLIRVYADPEQPQYCPVTIFEAFKSHRPSEMCKDGSPFYLQPKPSSSGDIWYKKQVRNQG